jgi:hypothetical protein
VRTCVHCKQLGGKGPRELRPYGPGGADVCAECTFRGPPERLKRASQELGKRLLHNGPLVLDDREQAGPRQVLRKKGKPS